MKTRLDRLLALAGAGTRSEVKKLVRSGHVRVNGQTVRDSAVQIDTELDRVELDGQRITYAEHVYYMLNKPAGVISSTERGPLRTVMELVPDRPGKGMFPAGRLDIDTEGLLLITDDGQLSHRLLSPRSHVDKTYLAKVSGRVTEEDREAFRNGIDIGDEKLTLPAELQILSAGEEESEVKVTIREGRFHQIKRMFEKRGKTVLFLKRLSMGPLRLDENLKSGEYRPLTQEELAALKECRR